jgi:hypothetical protein
MTFYELFETIDEKIEKFFKSTTDWCWEHIEDFHTHEWKMVARCYMKENDDIFHLLKKAGIKMGDKFYVKGIGKLEFDYKSQFARYYVELIEKANIEIMLT